MKRRQSPPVSAVTLRSSLEGWQLLSPSQAREASLVVFLWCALSILCGLGSFHFGTDVSIGRFIFCTVATLPVSALIILCFPKSATVVLLVSSWFLTFLPMLAYLPEQELVYLDLFYILLIAIPVFLRVWSWPWQVLAVSAVSFVSGYRLFVGDQGQVASFLLINIAAVLSVIVTVVKGEGYRTARKTATDPALIEQFSEYLERVKSSQFQQRFWSAPVLQTALVMVLVFLDTAKQGTDQMTMRVYAMIIVILGILFLIMVKRMFLGISLLFCSLSVALAVALTRTGEQSVLSFAVPLIFISFTTAGLPWFVEKQLVLAWVLTYLALFAKLLAEGVAGAPFSPEFSQALALHRTEIMASALGITASVIVGRYLEYYNLTHFARCIGESGFRKKSLKQRSLVTGTSLIRFSSRDEILALRTKALYRGFLLLGICSCFVSTILLIEIRFSLWTVAALGWASLFGYWALLVYYLDRKSARERVWMVAAAGIMLLVLIPAVLLVLVPQGRDFWIFLPVSILLGYGAIPWTLAEMLPLLGVSYLAGVQILSLMGLGSLGIPLLSGAALLSVIFATQIGVRLKEQYLLTRFQDAVHACDSERQTIRTLTDFLLTLFSTDSALISTKRDHLELLRDGTIYSLNPATWPLISLREEMPNFTIDHSGVGYEVLNWLPDNLVFFDLSFGEFSAHHGLMLEMRLVRHETQDIISSLSEKREVKRSRVDRFLLFIPFRWPIIPVLRRGDLVLAKTLSAIATLRLQSFYEQQERRLEQEGLENLRAEREYELSTLVHEINNTVQDLSLLCEGLLEDIPHNGHGTPEARVLDDAGNYSSRLRRIIVMARSMATVVSDAKRKRELERLPDLAPREFVEVVPVVREILEFAKIRGERRRIRVEGVTSQERLWVKVSAREHLETILRNLLNNAIMYTHPGGEVSLTLRSDPTWVWLEVKDNGPGLSSEECQSIFQSGVRGRFGSSVPGGLGIGLIESRRVAESAGGTLEVCSAGAGKGTTFTVRLPSEKAPPLPAKGKDSWILIVEDQPSLSEFYARVANALHLTPALASSTEEAEVHIRDRGRPTFVITDLHLGATDGLELVKSLRAKFDERLPILVVSGLNDDNVEQRVRDAGATDYLAKPVGKSTLFARIQSLLPTM